LEQKVTDTGEDVLLLNGGIGGSDVFYEYYKLKNLLWPQYQPEEVLIVVNSSDINDVVVRGGNERFGAETVRYKRGKWWEPIYASSLMVRLITTTLFEVQTNIGSLSENRRNHEKEKLSICNCISVQFVEFCAKNDFLNKVYGSSICMMSLFTRLSIRVYIGKKTNTLKTRDMRCGRITCFLELSRNKYLMGIGNENYCTFVL